jgi:hypothetical protein
MNHEIQVIDLSDLTSTNPCSTTISAFLIQRFFGVVWVIGRKTQVIMWWTRQSGGTPSGTTGPLILMKCVWYMLGASNPNFNNTFFN